MNNQTIQTITLILVVVTLVLWLTGNFWSQWNEWLTKQDVQQVVKDALKDVVPAPSQPTAPKSAPTPEPVPVATEIDLGELSSFYDTLRIEGNPDAKVTIVEFSDFQCGYCKKLNNNGTLPAVSEKYGDDVNIAYAAFPIFVPEAAQATECAGKIWGDEAFFSFKKALFAYSGRPDANGIKAVAEQEGLDADAIASCISDWEFSDKVNAQMAFGRKMWVTWTPGNVVYNNETGEYTLVKGAVPATSFDAPISSYLQ